MSRILLVMTYPQRAGVDITVVRLPTAKVRTSVTCRGRAEKKFLQSPRGRGDSNDGAAPPPGAPGGRVAARGLVMAVSHPHLQDISENRKGIIIDFGSSRFPRTFEEWNGIGPVTMQHLEDLKNITEPTQLLGSFLLMKQDFGEFAAFLKECGVPPQFVKQIFGQLWKWCDENGLAIPTGDE